MSNRFDNLMFGNRNRETPTSNEISKKEPDNQDAGTPVNFQDIFNTVQQIGPFINQIKPIFSLFTKK